MFLLRGMPFVDFSYLRKFLYRSDLRDNVITYRRQSKTGRRFLSGDVNSGVAMILVKKYMPNRDSFSPLSLSFLESGVKEHEKKRIGRICAVGVAQLLINN